MKLFYIFEPIDGEPPNFEIWLLISYWPTVDENLMTVEIRRSPERIDIIIAK